MTDISSIDNYDDAISYIQSSEFTALDDATKAEQIEQLIGQLPTAAPGETVLGYSGTINIQGSEAPLYSYQVAETVGSESSGTIITFDQTQEAQFLKSEDVQEVLGSIYNDTDLLAFNNAMTSQISADLAANSTGSVKTITGFMQDSFSGQVGGVSESSVYFQTELPAWLRGEATTINGIPRETLANYFESLAGHSIDTMDFGNPTDVAALRAVQNDMIAPKSINDIMTGLEIPLDSSGNPVLNEGLKLEDVGISDSYVSDVASGVPHTLDSGLTGADLASIIDLNSGEVGGLVDGATALSAVGVTGPVLDVVQEIRGSEAALETFDPITAAHDIAQLYGNEIAFSGGVATAVGIDQLAANIAPLVEESAADVAGEGAGAMLAAASGVGEVAAVALIEIKAGEALGLIDPTSETTLVSSYTWALQNPADVMKEAGMELGDAFHSLSAGINDALTHWGNSFAEGSPLVIDLSSGHTGITLTTFDPSTTATFYDLDRTGFAEQTAWITGNTGLLVQQNLDGSINLFGTSTIDGFAELAKLDSNHDLKIDSADADWSTLNVWLDSNGNGVVDSGELHSLASENITSIDLAGIAPSTTVINGNPISHTSTVSFGDGSTSEIADAWFVHSTVNTIYDGSYNLDLSTLFLPDLRGYGTIPDLDIAMSQDSTLKSEVSDFASGFSLSSLADPSTLDSTITNILYQWAGVEDVDPTSRGPNVDAQHLEFLEALYGQQFNQLHSPSWLNPDVYAGKDIEQSYQEIFQTAKVDLLIQLGAGVIFSNSVTYNPWTGDLDGDLSLSHAGINDLAAVAPTTSEAAAESFWVGIAEFIDYSKGLGSLTSTEHGWLDDAVTSTTTVTWDDIVDIAHLANPGTTIDGTSAGETLTGTVGDDSISGGGGNDTIYGDAGNDGIHLGASGDSTVYGGAGDDIITAQSGNNYLSGEAGNDTITGGSGDDTIDGGSGGNLIDSGGSGDTTYIFSGGDDVITENGGTDVINLPSGISLDDLTFTRVSTAGSNSNFYDLLISVDGGSGGSIQIVDQFLSSAHQIETLAFSDSSTLTLTSLTTADYGIVLTAGDDSYNGNALSTDQTVYGLDGSDAISTGSGNDTLDGGNGNDLLEGESGNDTYIASPGYDTVSDIGGTDTIVIPTGYDAADVTFARHIGVSGPDNSLVINIAGLGEILIVDQFLSSTYAIENLHFTDGNTTVSLASEVIQTIGSSGDDTLTGITSGVAGNWFDGRGGNDVIYDGIGDNTYNIAAGFGNTTIYQSYHSGTNVIDFEGEDPSHMRMWIGFVSSQAYLHLQDTTDTSHSILVQIGTDGSGVPLVGSYLQSINFDDTGHTSWDLTGGLALTGDNSGDYLYGTGYGDVITGGTGDDVADTVGTIRSSAAEARIISREETATTLMFLLTASATPSFMTTAVQAPTRSTSRVLILLTSACGLTSTVNCTYRIRPTLPTTSRSKPARVAAGPMKARSVLISRRSRSTRPTAQHGA